MSNYISSDHISVFPTTKRGTHQISARLTTEQSIVGVVNKLLDTTGFVITEGVIDTSSTSDIPFEFNIYGYYFSVDNANYIINSFTSIDTSMGIFAKIKLTDAGSFEELYGQDELENTEYIYKGVDFYQDSIPTDWSTSQASGKDGEYYYLLLFVYDTDNNKWEVDSHSRMKFMFEQATVIDGGEIT